MHSWLSVHLFDITRVVGTLLEVVLLAILARLRLIAAWPSIFVYCFLAVGVVLFMPSPHHRVPYFYCYWSWIALAALLRLWIFVDVLRNFPGIGLWSSRARLAVITTALTIAIGSALITTRENTIFFKAWISNTLLWDQGFAISTAAFLAVLLFALRYSNMGWTRTGSLLTTGLAIKAAATIVISYFLSSVHAGLFAGNVIQATSSIAMLALWLSALVSKSDESLNAVASNAEIQASES